LGRRLRGRFYRNRLMCPKRSHLKMISG
jgi:hypothetical protein